ncbi:hypothetical protein B0H16DRAFT_1461150 [Mycena metata]|uniref:Uncharacterized protein n=1 Tax=Mycena metata TaxID=1033252 RepID=A0AAD7IS47_9AGAR|nr:hypothetical protein B0H16DRAFT_1461150 [Mycena metata]
MQISSSFVALAFLSLTAALPQDTATLPVAPVNTARLPQATSGIPYQIATPAHVVAARKEYMAARANSTSTELAKRSVHCVANNVAFGDAIAAGQFIQGLSNTCSQTNGVGSFCTTMYCVGTACVDICGPLGNADSCHDAGNGLLDTANSCQYGSGVTGGCLRHLNIVGLLNQKIDFVKRVNGVPHGSRAANRWGGA